MTNRFPSQETRQKWQTFMQTLSPKADPLTIQLMDRLRTVARGLHLVVESSLTNSQLSLPKYHILLHLYFAEEHEGNCSLNPSEISQRQGTSRNTISALIRQLEADGFIERQLDKADRRRFNIKITPIGKTAVNQHIVHHLNLINSCFAQLTSDEQHTLEQLLNKLGQTVESNLTQPTSHTP